MSFLDNYTYNLTDIISAKAIEEPHNWLAAFNDAMGGYFIVTCLVVLGLALFLSARNLLGVKDSEAAVYSGLVITVVGLLLFFVDTGGYAKLLTWNQELVFIVITGLAILFNTINRRF